MEGRSSGKTSSSSSHTTSSKGSMVDISDVVERMYGTKSIKRERDDDKDGEDKVRSNEASKRSRREILVDSSGTMSHSKVITMQEAEYTAVLESPQAFNEVYGR